MEKKSDTNSARLRFNILTIAIYLIGIVLLLQLFNLQIIHGEEYRAQSNTRLTRQTVLEAARGNISDRTGNALATTKMGIVLELYKSKIDTKTLNNTILDVINILQENGEKYVDNLPITVEPFAFTIPEEEKQIKWKKENELEEQLTAEQCFYELKEEYKIEQEDWQEARKIMTIRYEIEKEGYSSTKPLVIAEDISSNTTAKLNEQNGKFPGISTKTVPIRDYVKGSLASHIIGYIGRIDEDFYKANKDTYDMNDNIGRMGIEYVFEKYLKGKNGIKQIDMSVDGGVTDENIAKEAVQGSNVVLTIDANLQQVTENALKNNIEKINNGGFSSRYETNSGACVVMNVKTGEVLAMASYPVFEPGQFIGGISNEKWNEYTNTTTKPLTNRAIQVDYAPGSIFKMINAVAALESGVTTISEKINDTGIYPYYHKPKCWYYTDYHTGHGRLNVSGAIQKSCNYYFYEMGRRMGTPTLAKYASYFGLGKKTGVELPSEAEGHLPVENKQEPGNILSVAIGQGDNSYTVIQIAKYISMLCNGGKDIDVSLVKTIINAEGTEIPKQEINDYVKEKLGISEEKEEPLEIKKENLDAVLEGMRSVAMETGGTAANIFRDFAIEVGGKTGSAEAGNKTNAWFAGFAPFDDPEIAVVVVVENGGHGNYTAEAVREIMAEYFGMNAKRIEENMEAIPTTEIIR